MVSKWKDQLQYTPCTYGCFPKSSHFNRVFHYKPSILGVSLFLETPIYVGYELQKKQEDQASKWRNMQCCTFFWITGRLMSRYILKKQTTKLVEKKNIEISTQPKDKHQSTQHTSTKSLFFPPFLLQIISFSSRSSKTLEEQGSQVPLLLERKPSKHLLHPKAAGSRPPPWWWRLGWSYQAPPPC